MLKIKNVDSGSIAADMNLEPGDKILKINNKRICDVLDFLASESKSKLKLLIQKNNGDLELLIIKKNPMEGIGIDFGKGTELYYEGLYSYIKFKNPNL